MKKLFAITVPILPGKTAQWKKFASELNGKYYNEFAESRKRLKVQERTFFQSTPHGDFIIVTLEGENPEKAFSNFASSNDAFTKWFVKEAKELHGIDLTQKPDSSLPELVIDSHAAVLHG
jgi:hypothetical protein